ncbi:hypothetical protein PPACK8108_LOCUS16011 [Phakopsora pachyrhizi]|uniref:Uncharacterized protein n=1 Tax=Phakopsora pachyrhizi TaxID=170000 RepID=A0AAV0BAN7_PHAPC|nr:hypothetical protein PPACK8108_LOCUS16011 [Phakopsora pachyrhizi]
MRLTGKSEWEAVQLQKEATLQEEGRSDRAPAQEEDNRNGCNQKGHDAGIEQGHGGICRQSAGRHTHKRTVLAVELDGLLVVLVDYHRLYQISTGLMVVLSEKKEPLYERVRSEEEENKK